MVKEHKIKPADKALIECLFDEMTDHDDLIIMQTLQEVRATKMTFAFRTFLFPFWITYATLTGGWLGAKDYMSLQRAMWRTLRTPKMQLMEEVCDELHLRR